MPLITCKDCKQEFSTDAKQCPKCGAKKPKNTSTAGNKLLKIFFILFFGSAFIQAMTNISDSRKPAPTAEEIIQQEKKSAAEKKKDALYKQAIIGAITLKRAAKDPDTFEMKSAIVHQNGSACYTYRAANSFNARLLGSAVLTPRGKILIEADGNNFVHEWNKNCTTNGFEITELMKNLE